MIVKQTAIFKRCVKKMHSQEKMELDKVIKTIIATPSLGQMKTGDLSGIQVHKYQFKAQQYLVAYEYKEDELVLTFVEHGTHENFYRDLKKK
jgi:mRNA-degrading endonuclease YafQ of YafQ-DinJ toxin-antitoxin module